MIRVIPAIDLIEGRPVRLQQGDFKRLMALDRGIPELIAEIKKAGLDHLHLVNLSAAKAGRLRDQGIIAEIVSSGLRVDYGGGIRSLQEVEELFDLGVAEVNIGSMIIKDAKTFKAILAKYPKQVIASLDLKGDRVAVNAWQEQSSGSIYDLIKSYLPLGLEKVCVTDIARDGMMGGPALDLYQRLIKGFPQLQLIASGGIRNRKDVMALEKIGCAGLVVGKAWLGESVKLAELC